MPKYLTPKEPPRNRAGKHEGTHELHFSEMAMMLAVAEWLFSEGASKVHIHPDGMHLKQFEAAKWLQSEGFIQISTSGRTGLGGEYRRQDQTLVIYSRPGLGDVVARIDGRDVEVETKGGCINSKHAGQVSKLRRGLQEAVGQLMSSPRDEGARLIAAVPSHPETEKVSQRLLERCNIVGIDIALLSADGTVNFVN